ncbi:MAG: N-acyl-D-amino-acid deacylase family protein [Polymorphobacter sp.]
MRRIVTWLCAFAAALPAAAAAKPNAIYDIIIRGGTILDGSGGAPQQADLAIDHGFIMRVGTIADAVGRQTYDATGLYVAPGFISIHDHTDDGLQGRPIGLISQGVTTAIGNPDGFGPVDDILKPMRSLGKPGINYGAYIGFNSVWEAVVGNSDRRASAAEIGRMQALVRSGLQQGAFGVSAGLDYKPGFFATTAEVTEVVTAARGWRTNFPNHDRLFAGNGFSSFAGQAETIAIAKAAGLMPVVTHMHLLSRDQGRADDAFRMFAASAQRGVPVGVDAYPYTYAATALEQILIPAWAQAGGKSAMLQRFADPVQRARITAETDAVIETRIRGAKNIYLPDMKRELVDIVADRHVSPGEAIVQLIEQGETHVILRSVTDADRDRILRDPLTAISCDCGAIASQTGHPRNWGAYPRFFGHYVRDRHIAAWPEAVRRATALPAAMIGLVDRGWLRPGMAADVTLFDPATIIDRATIEQPVRPSIGIAAVIVNGRFAWRDGVFTPDTGMILRRGRSEPTRLMEPAIDTRIKAQLALPAGVWLDVKAGHDRAGNVDGHAVITGIAGGARFTIDHPGLLQTSDGWAALTGTGHWGDGRAAAATLVIDDDFSTPAKLPGVRLVIDGKVVIDGLAKAGHSSVKRSSQI